MIKSIKINLFYAFSIIGIKKSKEEKKNLNDLEKINDKLGEITKFLEKYNVKNTRILKQIFFQYKVDKIKFSKEYTFISGYSLQEEKKSSKSNKSKIVEEKSLIYDEK